MKNILAFIVMFLSVQIHAQAPWPMIGHDARHTGLSEYSGPENPEVKWKYTVGGTEYVIFGSIIGPDNSIYFGTWDSDDPGKVYALNSDSSLKWSYNLKTGVRGMPAYDNHTIYVASQDSNFYAFEDSTGKFKWKYWIGESFASPTVGSDGTVYIVSNERKIFAITSAGTLKWSLIIGLLDESLWSPPAIFGSTIYVGSSDKNLHAIDTSGTEKWTFPTSGQIQTCPALSSDGNRVYVGSCDGCFYVIDSTGKKINSFQTGDIIVSSPAIRPDGNVYASSMDGYLYTFNPDGNLIWSCSTGVCVTEIAVDAKGTAYVHACDNQTLYAINPDSTVKWTLKVGGENLFAPTIGSDGRIYLGGCYGNFYCLGETDTIGIEEDIPKGAVLRNYPNPFYKQTAISYQLPVQSKVSLRIYNVSGRLIRTLVNKKIKAGIHSVCWDGKDESNKEVSSGIYFYQLNAEIGKMTLIR
jgi:outer membrane protein assembly factor BamB